MLLHFKGDAVLDYADLLEGLPVPFVLDHFGGVDPATGGTDQASFRLIARHLRNGNGWVKTSAIEKISGQSYPFADAAEIASAFLSLAPDRVLWGTDWPHPNMQDAIPDDGHLVDMIPRIAPTADLQRKLLIDNPMRLYWPEELSA